MFDMIKSFVEDKDHALLRKEFLSLTSEFEKNTDDPIAENTVAIADRLRRVVKTKIPLERSEKIRLLKVLNKGKVRALLLGTDEGNRIFKNLDTISFDIIKHI